jgi:hypothetical protein
VCNKPPAPEHNGVSFTRSDRCETGRASTVGAVWLDNLSVDGVTTGAL